MSQIRNAVVFACSLVAAGGGIAHAAEDHAVSHRLSAHGKLSSAAAKKLASKVSQRMARSADAPPTLIDPLRVSLSQALLGVPVAQDQITAAKVRLKLYAGLNEFALEALFAPRPGAIAGCVRDVGASESECAALVAADAKAPVSKVRSVAGGPAVSPMMAAAPMGAPAGGSRFGGGAPAGGSRFGGQQQPQAAPQGGFANTNQQQGFGGGYRPPQAYQQQPQVYQQQAYQQQPQAYQPQPQQAYQQQQQRFQQQPQPNGYAAAPGYAARPNFGGGQPGYAAAGQGNFGARPAPVAAYQPAAGPVAVAQPAYRPAPAPVARPMATAPAPVYTPPAPAAPAVNPAEVEARKEAYKAQREAYMARQKQQFEERRAKAAGLEPEPQAAPVAGSSMKAAPAAPVAAAKPAAKVAAPSEQMASVESKRPAAAAPPPEKDETLLAPAPAAAPAAKGDKQLDGDFLDGLLDDPLGGKGKK
jgi:hypothetical protein